MNNSRWPKGTYTSVLFLILLILPIVGLLTWSNHHGQQVVREAKASVVATPTPVAQNITGAETGDTEAHPVVITTPEPVNSEHEAIDDYIRTIFGKDAKVAIAVNRVECNPKNKQYPSCVYHTEYEYSVGIFQINLYNKSHWIHAKKVPGNTMEEKVEWLKNPFNNTLIAYKIFTDSGFGPWSGFTSGRYLDHLGE